MPGTARTVIYLPSHAGATENMDMADFRGSGFRDPRKSDERQNGPSVEFPESADSVPQHTMERAFRQKRYQQTHHNLRLLVCSKSITGIADFGGLSSSMTAEMTALWL
eukprot:GHVU01045425.1.p2 GENE.GHVU01045425.1~~GHVU01045425.1.p2  ORF type:complete len:108 (-),score=1.92 GHVU01045425.1:1068-1391(-)